MLRPVAEASVQRGAIQFATTIGQVNSMAEVEFAAQAAGMSAPVVKPTAPPPDQGSMPPSAVATSVSTVRGARTPSTHSWRTGAPAGQPAGSGAAKTAAPPSVAGSQPVTSRPPEIVAPTPTPRQMMRPPPAAAPSCAPRLKGASAAEKVPERQTTVSEAAAEAEAAAAAARAAAAADWSVRKAPASLLLDETRMLQPCH